MRHSAASVLLLLGLSTGTVFADSVGKEIPEPVEVSASGETAKPVVPEPAPTHGKKPAAVPVTALESTTVRASSGVAPAPAPVPAPATPVETVPPVVVPAPVTNQPVPGKIARQVISAYYVNRVKVLLPAGVKVITHKDWYTNTITVVYAANPYTNWRGVTPDAFVFKHPGTTLELLPSGTKYVPQVIDIYVPTSVEVIVN